MINLGLKKILFLQIVLIIVLGFTIYANSLHGKFLWDDEGLIKYNSHIRHWSKFPTIFIENMLADYGEQSNHYRPIQIVTYMVDYYIWKLNVVGYHLTNILLHICATLTVYWLIYILFNNWRLAFAVSLLFIAHPIQTSTVAYISGRADSLVTIFIMLSFILYIKYLNSKSSILLIFISLTYILALLCRENALIFPALLLLYCYTFKQKLNLSSLVTLLGITFVYVLIRTTVLKSLLVDISGTTTLLQRLPGLFVAINRYLRLLLLPLGLHVEYGKQMFSLTDPKTILGLLMTVLLLIYASNRRRSNKLVSFSINWFFIALIPYSNIYPINAYMAENWLYLPSIGFFLLLADGLVRLYNIRKLRLMAIISMVSIISFYSFLTMKQNLYWKEPIIFYERNLKYSPKNSKLLNNLGKAYYERGEEEKAINLLQRAIEVNPNSLNAYKNLAAIYSNIGKVDQAISWLRKVIEINPKDPKVYYNLGNLYDNIKEYEKAVEAYKKAIEINPKYIEAYNNLASALTSMGEIEKAIELWNKILQINPKFTAAHFNLAVFYFQQKKYDLAIRHCDKVRESGDKVDPEFLRLLEPYRK